MPEGTRNAIPPAVQAARMQRYSVYLIVVAFLLVGLNYATVALDQVLWFAAGILTVFGLLCAICVVILQAIAWNFERLREELTGGRQSLQVGSPDPDAPKRPSSYILQSEPTERSA